MSGQMVKNEPLETFGKWQTELYIPPPAKEREQTSHHFINVFSVKETQALSWL
jgi:hypothetical protein